MILTLFESVQRAYTRPEWIVDNTWPEIAKFLTTHQEAKTKEEVPLFNLWQFRLDGEPGRKRIYENKEPTENYETVEGTIRRCKANAEACWGIVLDYDGKEQISEVCENLSNFDYAIYTTFRHTEETNKFRVVLPFSRACPQERFRRKQASIQATFGAVDHASFSESQSFYLHSGPNKFSMVNKGLMLDPDWFEDEVEQPIPEIKRSTEFTGDRNVYKEMLIDSLATCSGLHYASDVSNHGVLTLVALCKSGDFTYDEFNLICRNMAASDSSLQDEKLRKSAWFGWAPHSGITAKVREEFIAAYGGVSKFGVKEKSRIDIMKHRIEKLKKLSNQ